MKRHFTNSQQPLLVGSLRNRNVDETVADIRNCEADGARAFILHIQMLDREYRNPQELKRIFAATRHPVMAIYYRSDGDVTEAQRTGALLEAVEMGAACVDLPADTFDTDSRASLKDCALPFAEAHPNEISMREVCIERQRQFIAQVHALGAEVLMSAHVMPATLTAVQVVSLALEMEARGADIVKIVACCPNVEHALEIFRSMVELKRRLTVPYVYICTGPYGELVRPLGPLFGSMLVFGHHEYNARSNPAKQLLGNMRELYRILPWRFEDSLEQPCM